MISKAKTFIKAKEQLEIVGFEGKPTSACGYALPLVNNIANRNYFKGTTEETEILMTVAYTEDDITELEEAGRLTRLLNPMPYVPKSVVLFVHCSFLDILKKSLSSKIDKIEWIRLGDEISVTAAPLDAVEAMTDNWGEILLDKLRGELKDFVPEKTHAQEVKAESIAKLADMALCAADKQILRQKIYFCYALALEQSSRPERVENLYRYFFQPEFRSWTKEAFSQRLNHLNAEFFGIHKAEVKANSSGQQSVIRRPYSAAQHERTKRLYNNGKSRLEPKDLFDQGKVSLIPSASLGGASHEDVKFPNHQKHTLFEVQDDAQGYKNSGKLKKETIRALAKAENRPSLDSSEQTYRKPKNLKKQGKQAVSIPN